MKKLLVPFLLVVSAPALLGFSLLGPPKEWQVQALGYQLPGDIGAPMGLTEGYRWNITNITYAFDESFLKYFGSNGVAAIDSAFAILNALPPASEMNLDNFPLDTTLINHLAQDAQLLDLKSHALSMIVEELGLAEPERWVWALRSRNTVTIGNVTYTNYVVIKLNFDPYTLQPSSYVNNVLYTYTIEDPIPTINYADAIESPVAQASKFLPFSSVAGAALSTGEFYFGLDRDTVGGLKFLLSTNNLAAEGVLSNVFPAGPLSGVGFGWVPYQGTTNTTTNFFFTTNFFITPALLAGLTNASNFVAVGIRGGANKLHFTKVYYDSLIGNAFTPLTNRFFDNVIVTNKLIQQELARVIDQPDIVFVAEDLGLVNNLIPVLMQRTGTASWANNDAINGLATQGGPGVINGQIRISFSNQLPYFQNQTPNLLDEASGIGGFVWGSFDQTAKPPVVYPQYLNYTVDDLLAIMASYTNVFTQP